ncbi:hypothetical protein ACVW16_000259 [Bradyrhizobium sp. USDA 4474]
MDTRDWLLVKPDTETTMTSMKRMSAAALIVILPLSAASPSVAAGRGPGRCTPPGDQAVGAAGPAMSGGQLMAGVGQCQRIGSWQHGDRYGYRANSRYNESRWGASVFQSDEY